MVTDPGQQVVVDQPEHSEQDLRNSVYDAVTAAGYTITGMTEGVYGITSPRDPDLMITLVIHRTPVARRG